MFQPYADAQAELTCTTMTKFDLIGMDFCDDDHSWAAHHAKKMTDPDHSVDEGLTKRALRPARQALGAQDETKGSQPVTAAMMGFRQEL